MKLLVAATVCCITSIMAGPVSKRAVWTETNIVTYNATSTVSEFVYAVGTSTITETSTIGINPTATSTVVVTKSDRRCSVGGFEIC